MGLALTFLCNFGIFLIYLYDLYSMVSDMYFMICLYSHFIPCIIRTLYLVPRHRFQYLYVRSSMMSVYPKGGGSARDTRVSVTSVDMVSRLVKCCWMSTFPMVCRGSRWSQPCSSPSSPPRSDWGVGGT